MAEELVPTDVGLAEYATECAGGELTVKGDDTSHIALLPESPENDMAPGLPPTHETNALQRANCLFT